MSDNLFNPEAFEQMPGQMSMEQVERTFSGERIAERAKFYDARRWFEAGGTVLVAESGHEPTIPVRRATTTHSRDSIAWNDLVYYVRTWRNRYPNQRFYIVRGER